MSKVLDGRVALVTGAASGMGRAIAYRYADEGASLVLSDLNEKGGHETLSGVDQRGAQGVFMRADVTKPADSRALVETALKKFGGLHVACNNAGIAGEAAKTGDYPIEDWDKVIAVDLSGVFYGMRWQIPAMVKGGGGAIVNIASVLGQVGFRGSPAYVAAKHGVVGLTRTAALEYARDKVRINAIGPGFTDTPLLSKLPKEQLDRIVNAHAMKRLGEPAEIAELALWLSSDKASFATGGYYPLDGGYLAQ